MLAHELKPNVIVRGPLFPEPVQVLVVVPMGTSVKLVGKGLTTGKVHEPILNADQLVQLICTADKEPFDGDPMQFRLGIEALRLALAYEYDPYFSLSIARVDPLPHQLEAVYDFFLKLPRIRFLLADDPGAGEKGVPALGNTVLDRIHQSMILFAAGRSEALKRFLVEDGVGRDARYWRLAQALSALYPAGTDEKRWVDGVLARKKGLGF